MAAPPPHPDHDARLTRRPEARPDHRCDAPEGRTNAQDDDWPVARPRPLGLRLLALLGALSFVLLGLSSLAPLLQPQPERPTPMPDQNQQPLS